jgi:hypothetical protein
MGRKERLISTRGVKLDADLVAKAKTLARDGGQTRGDDVTAILRPVIESEWAKLLHRTSEEAG